ncbi:MAG: hypothetical protein ACLPXZ_15320 [Mycobacterium sp.]
MHANDESAASDEPIRRHELVPLPQMYSGIFTKAPPTPPPLVLGLGMDDAIQVIDPDTNTLIASASVAQVTARPARHRAATGDDDVPHTDPLLIVAVPGVQPLRIRPSPMKYGILYTRGDYRYTWRDIFGGPDQPPSGDQPTYGVTEADWLALVEKFGLSSRLVDDYGSGEMALRNRRAMIRSLVGLALCLLFIALMAYLKYGR